jgi:hypothetical protein
MKKTVLLIIVLVALLLATPALAREKEPTGDRIIIHPMNAPPTQDYPAETPFYIAHGWIEIPPHAVPGQVFFELELDGVIVKPTYVEHTTVVGEYGPSPFFDKTWFFNFPEGLTGQHIFEGHWIGPCFVALYYGLVDECANPMADYDWVYSEVMVNFD